MQSRIWQKVQERNKSRAEKELGHKECIGQGAVENKEFSSRSDVEILRLPMLEAPGEQDCLEKTILGELYKIGRNL